MGGYREKVFRVTKFIEGSYFLLFQLYLIYLHTNNQIMVTKTHHLFISGDIVKEYFLVCDKCLYYNNRHQFHNMSGLSNLTLGITKNMNCCKSE
jgi:hypothetical protein